MSIRSLPPFRRIYRSEISLAIAAQLLQFGMGLFIMPMALVRLNSAELGLWYVFFAVQSMVMLLDFGFTQTFSRHFAYIFGGAQFLHREGLPPSSVMPLNPSLLAATIVGARRLYLALAVIAALVLATAGTAYIITIAGRSGLERDQVLFGWGIFCLAACLSIYFQWQSALLSGADRVSQTYKIGIVSRMVQLISSLAALALAPSIVTLAAAYAASIVSSYLYSHYSTRDLIPSNAASVARHSQQSPSDILNILWHGSSRLGLVFIGSFLITRSNTFSISYFLGLSVSAQYAVTMQIFNLAQALATTAFAINYPKMSGARLAGNMVRLRELFLKSLSFSWIVYAFIAAAAIAAGPYIIYHLGSKTSLPGREVMILLASVLFLEMNHSLCANAIVTSNRVPFVRAALISGIAIAAAAVAIGLVGGTLLGFIAAQGLIQLSYNNWKWPLVVMRDFKIRRAPTEWITRGF